jgi:hypothetical protein
VSISTKVVEALNELGFALTPKPEYDIPSLPRDITELDDEGLMDLFVQYTQWNDHLAGAFAIAVVNEREADSSLKNAEAVALLNNWTGAKGDRVTLVKAQIQASEAIQELIYDYDTKYAFRKLIETRTQNIERDANVVSRELTRRTSDGGLRSRQRRYTT